MKPACPICGARLRAARTLRAPHYLICHGCSRYARAAPRPPAIIIAGVLLLAAAALAIAGPLRP